MQRIAFGPGVFPDLVAAQDGDGWWVTWQDDQHRVVVARLHLNGVFWFERVYEHVNDLAFPRVSPTGAVAYRGADDRLYVNGARFSEAVIGGNRPILVSPLYVYAQHAPTNGVYRYPWDGGLPDGPIRFSAGTGLSRLTADGVLHTWDEDRAIVAGILSPSWTTDALAGELPDGGVLVRHDVLGDVRLDPGRTTNDPRVAYSDGRWAVVFWTPTRIAPGVDRADAFAVILDASAFTKTDPVHLPAGTVVDDVRGWLLGDLAADRWPRSGTHEMTPVVQDRSVYWCKFGELGGDATSGWPYWERWAWDADWILHLEDHSDGASYAWDASDRRWMPRTWAVGESFIVDTWQRNYNAAGEQTFERPFRYEMTCEALIQGYPCGGDIGTSDVLVVRYDPRLGEKLRADGSRPGHYERFYFAKGWGWYRWEAWRTPAAGQADTREHVSLFAHRGGRLVQPGAGVVPAAWWATAPPDPPDPPDTNDPPDTPPEEPPVTERPPVTDYDTFLNECEAIEEALTRALTVEQGGPTRPSVRDIGHNAWRRLVERWDFPALINAIYTERGQVGPFGDPPPPDAPVATRRIVGQLRREADHFVDDTGPVLPLLCHFGEAFSAFTRGRADDVLAQLDALATAGYHGIRVWTTLPSDDGSRPGIFWRGRSVNEQDTPGYWDQLAAFLAALKARGLVAHLAQGDFVSIRDPHAFAVHMAAIIQAVGPEVVALFEGLNEARDTGQPDAAAMAAFVRRVRERVPVLCGLSAYTGTEDVRILDDWSRDPADLFLVHGYRAGRWWDKVRHIFSLQYEGRPSRRLGWQGEPCGPGPEVSVTEHRHELEDPTLGPARLSAMALMALMTRQAWVYMSGAGVLFNRPVIDEVGCRAVAQAAALLPRDVMTYRTLTHGGVSKPDRVFAAWKAIDGPDDDVPWVRCDHALHDDGRFVCLLYGPADVRGAQPVRACTIEADHVLSPEVRLVIGRV